MGELTEAEAITKALQMATALQDHCKQHDLLEGIFHGVCVDAARYRDALINDFVFKLIEEFKSQDVGTDVAAIVDNMLDKRRKH